jgi:hypothetical protein
MNTISKKIFWKVAYKTFDKVPFPYTEVLHLFELPTLNCMMMN